MIPISPPRNFSRFRILPHMTKVVHPALSIPGRCIDDSYIFLRIYGSIFDGERPHIFLYHFFLFISLYEIDDEGELEDICTIEDLY